MHPRPSFTIRNSIRPAGLPPIQEVKPAATVNAPWVMRSGSAGRGRGAGPATTRAPAPGSYTEPWQGHRKHASDVRQPDTSQPACVQMAENATTPWLAKACSVVLIRAMLSRTSSTWLKREPRRTVPVAPSIGHARSGGPPAGRSWGRIGRGDGPAVSSTSMSPGCGNAIAGSAAPLANPGGVARSVPHRRNAARRDRVDFGKVVRLQVGQSVSARAEPEPAIAFDPMARRGLHMIGSGIRVTGHRQVSRCCRDACWEGRREGGSLNRRCARATPLLTRISTESSFRHGLARTVEVRRDAR